MKHHLSRAAAVLLFLLGSPLSAQTPAKPAVTTPSDSAPKLWVNYDFVPGSRVLYYNDYAAADNLKLSEGRAMAVVAALVKDQGIDPARLAAKGMSSTKPAAPNTTAEGRQNNRRVVLVKV